MKRIPPEFARGEAWFNFHGAFSRKLRIAIISGVKIVWFGSEYFKSIK